MSATIANETAPSTAIPVHKIFVCHPVVSVKVPIVSSCPAALKMLAGPILPQCACGGINSASRLAVPVTNPDAGDRRGPLREFDCVRAPRLVAKTSEPRDVEGQ